jgi:hypothetical protein
MKVSRLSIVIGLMILATGALAIGRFNSTPVQPSAIMGKTSATELSAKRGRISQKTGGGSTTEPQSIPKHIVYGLLFREIIALQKTADRLEREGKEVSVFRTFHKEKAGLNDKENQILVRIANDCQAVLDTLDRRATEVIQRDDKRYPEGRLKKGEPLPEVPKELKELEEQRRQTILEARDRLQSEFGDEAFARFDDFEQAEIESRAKPAVSTALLKSQLQTSTVKRP